MELFRYDEIPWTDPQVDAGLPSRGIDTKKLAQGAAGFFAQSSRMPAGLRIEPHSHTADELFVVFEGGATFDDGTVVSANDFVVFPANQVYGFTVGPEGMRFAVVRKDKSALVYAT